MITGAKCGSDLNIEESFSGKYRLFLDYLLQLKDMINGILNSRKDIIDSNRGKSNTVMNDYVDSEYLVYLKKN